MGGGDGGLGKFSFHDKKGADVTEVPLPDFFLLEDRCDVQVIAATLQP